jgi:hypothetical protein
MDRQAKVESVYTSVKSITEADAFRYVIEKETDDNVLADLRARFWDGHGKKPWQVIEINREITHRKDKRGSTKDADGHDGIQVAKITARQAIIVAFITAAAGLGGAFIGKATGAGSEADAFVLRDSVRQLNRAITGLQMQIATPRPWLYLTGMFFNKKGAQARVFASVDGIAYTFPTAMAWGDGDQFVKDSLPLATLHAPQNIRFFARYALPHAPLRDAGSSEIITVPAVPYAGEYRLYEGSLTNPGGPLVARVQFAIRPPR